MSTNDVPGAVAAHNDTLHTGCWAEHPDGSLIFVDGVEGGKVVYDLFDMAPDPPLEYRYAMAESEFKRQFSWDPKAKTIKAIQWTWHDKTSFPWDRVMEDFKPGQKATSALATMTAAQRVAEQLQLRAQPITEQRARTGKHMLDRIADALRSLKG